MEELKQRDTFKACYEAPKINVVQFACEDIITTSANGDENQGEWDPQTW